MYETLVSFIKYLWGLHWIFRINPFYILYIVVGPAIIFGYMKPQMSFIKRQLITISAIIISIIFYILIVGYYEELRRYEYEECSATFENSINIIDSCVSAPNASLITTNNPKLQLIAIILIFILLNPFLGVPHLLWYLYHRNTIRGMKEKFYGKRLCFFIISTCLWWPFAPIIISYSLLGVKTFFDIIKYLVY